MLPTAIVVFREVLEASLILSIIMAVTRGVRGRGLWISAGVGLGLAGAGLTALFADAISNAVSGVGQELFNAAILFAAVVMLGWHNVWMQRHGREMAMHMKQVGNKVVTGENPLYILAVVVTLAVMREGSELVLFLYGIAAQGSQSVAMLAGFTLGMGAGAAVSVALYFGLLRIPTKYLFSVTAWMILLLASGMASQGAAFLVQANLLPALGHAVWDTSRLLPESSVIGQVLHTLIGYVAAPAGIQVVFYVTTLAVIGVLMQVCKPPHIKQQAPSTN
jgi:high-affinity iron transporter